jgi:UDP-N-acetylmuramoylalanine--D-glutamate ligase
MITVTEYKGQSVGVFGLGKAGKATVSSLIAGGAQIWASDDSEASIEKLRARLGNKIQLKPVGDWPWKNLKALVLSPGVPLTHPEPHAVVKLAREFKCPVIGDLELLYRACPEARYIGITGTNGKSTTTTLIGHILKTAGIKTEIGGNLGTPALALKPLGSDGAYVIEASSYQLDLLEKMRFNVALLLNVTPDHLDRHGDMQGYIAAKKHIFDRQQAGDTAIIAIDDDYTRVMANEMKRVVKVSAHAKTDGVYVEDGVLRDGKYTFDLKSIVTLTGRHNWQNAAAAYAAARACGVAPEMIYKSMQSFAGLRHRLQLVATIHGVRFINDSKATNADATSNALAPYDTIYWILGGKPKEGGITTLTGYFPKIAHAFLIGQAEGEFANTLDGKVRYTRCGTLKTAVEKAAAMAFAEKKSGAVVLLSPACASFDQWKNFEERGDAFCDMVQTLSAQREERHAV